MVQLERYQSFASLGGSDRIEQRLRRRYLECFDRIASLPDRLLPGQRDVSHDWQEDLGSIVRAIAFDVIPGVQMVLVLLDDEDFGRELKWYFATDRPVDHKHLVMAAEGATEILSTGPGRPLQEHRDIDVRDLGDCMVRSSMFCFSFPASSMIPETLPGVASWEVARGATARFADRGASRTLIVSTPVEPDGPLLLLLRAQIMLLDDR